MEYLGQGEYQDLTVYISIVCFIAVNLIVVDHHLVSVIGVVSPPQANSNIGL